MHILRTYQVVQHKFHYFQLYSKYGWVFFYWTFKINLLISLETLLAHENIELLEGFTRFFFKFGYQVYLCGLISLFNMV